MRGLILEERQGSFIILTKDGQFQEISKKLSYINDKGEVVIKSRILTYGKRVAATAAIFIMLFFGYTWFTPYGYTTIDINPSMEITYNRYDRVLGINGLNEEGREIVGRIEKGSSFSSFQAIEELLEAARKSSFIIDDGSEILIVEFYGHKNLEKRLNQLKAQVEGLDYPSRFTILSGNHKEYRELKKRVDSPGRYMQGLAHRQGQVNEGGEIQDLELELRRERQQRFNGDSPRGETQDTVPSNEKPQNQGNEKDNQDTPYKNGYQYRINRGRQK